MQLPDAQQEHWKQQAVAHAVQLIEDGMVIGLGTGSTAMLLAQALAQPSRCVECQANWKRALRSGLRQA